MPHCEERCKIVICCLLEIKSAQDNRDFNEMTSQVATEVPVYLNSQKSHHNNRKTKLPRGVHT